MADALFNQVQMKYMSTQLNKYIEIKRLSNPENAFKRLEHEFIDIMYPDHFSKSSLVMLLDIGIDPNTEDDRLWLTELLNTVLPEIGETNYLVAPYVPEN